MIAKIFGSGLKKFIELLKRLEVLVMENIVIRKISSHEVESAMELALEVFMQFEAPDYTPIHNSLHASSFSRHL